MRQDGYLFLAKILRLAPIAVLACSIALHAFHVKAQAFDLDRFHPTPDGDGFLGVASSRTPPSERWIGSLWIGVATHQLSVSSGSRMVQPIRERLTAEAQLEVGLFGRLALYAGAPVVLFQSGDVIPAFNIQSPGLGHPRVGARMRLLGEDATTQRKSEGPGLALNVQTTIPVGTLGAFAMERDAILSAQLIGDFHALGLGFAIVVGYRHRFASVQLLDLKFGSELEFMFAARAPLQWVQGLSALVEIRGNHEAEDPFGPIARTVIEIDGGLRYVLDEVTLSLTAGAGLSPGVGAPGFRSAIGVEWAPQPHDLDRDGVGDGQDLCRSLPEDRDGHDDADGCPDPDNDSDGVIDVDDVCPNERAAEGHDVDEDGCTDAS